MTSRTFREILYVMNTKLTLRMDEVLVRQAKTQAARRGKSVSRMFAEFVASQLYDGSWETPRLWLDDGAVADW